MYRFAITLICYEFLFFAPGDYVEQDGHHCPLIGTAASTIGKDLNRNKNRSVAPADDEIDPEVSLAAMLAPGNDTDRFDEARGAKIIAFVVDVKEGGKETCNCEATNPIDMDTHIELAASPDAVETERVIVEVTPRIRKQMGDKSVDWSTDALRQQFKGKWVQVTGWLLFDSMHIDAAENTNPGGDTNWRATCWEIHPVTAITKTDPPPAAPQLALALATIRTAHREHVQNSPQSARLIKARQDRYLGRYKKEELVEKEAELKANLPRSARK